MGLLMAPMVLADKLGDILAEPAPNKNVKELDSIINSPDQSAADTTADDILKFASEPYTDKELHACIRETIKPPTPNAKDIPGPDDGYVITIMEEPLNTEEVGETKIGGGGDDYVVRRCYRNSFQYTKVTTKDGKKSYSTQTVPALLNKCSATAQGLMTSHKNDKELNIKYSCKEVQVILTKGGTSAIYGYISMLYRWGASMVGNIAVTVIIASGIQISASGGDSEAINSAKKRILQSITGIIVLFLSSLILYTINPTFFTK